MVLGVRCCAWVWGGGSVGVYVFQAVHRAEQSSESIALLQTNTACLFNACADVQQHFTNGHTTPRCARKYLRVLKCRKVKRRKEKKKQ